MQGVTEPISRILSTAGLKVAMKPHCTLRQLLVHPKDKEEDLNKAGVVYKVDCKECDASYIGQTGRHLKERIKEHRSALEKGNTQNSGIAEHAYEAHHEISWDTVCVLDQESNTNRRLVRESLHIRTAKPSMNRESGVEIPVTFMKIIGEEKHLTVHHNTGTSAHQRALRRAEDGSQ